MAEVVLFHHVQGLTDGIRAFADDLRSAGHTVHTPDLFDGALPATLEEGVALTRTLGDDLLTGRAAAAVDTLPPAVVFGGWSSGVMLAQRFAQTRPGAAGALLFEACVPISGPWAFGPWPDGVPVQVHGMDADPFFALEGDLDAARELVASVPSGLAELFVYPGDRHLFSDRSLASYTPDAAAAVLQRCHEFLARIG